MPPHIEIRRRGYRLAMQVLRREEEEEQTAPPGRGEITEEEFALRLEESYTSYGYEYFLLCRRGERRPSTAGFVSFLAAKLDLTLLFDVTQNGNRYGCELTFGPFQAVASGPTEPHCVHDAATKLLFELLVLFQERPSGPQFVRMTETFLSPADRNVPPTTNNFFAFYPPAGLQYDAIFLEVHLNLDFERLPEYLQGSGFLERPQLAVRNERSSLADNDPSIAVLLWVAAGCVVVALVLFIWTRV